MEEERGPYNPIIMDHFTHPRNMGEIENADGIGEVKNPACGDTTRFFIRIEADRIIEARFLTFGCGPAIAASSIATEMVKGKTVEEASGISEKTIAEALGGLPPTKAHCSVLAEKAIQAALSDYRKRS